MGRRWRLALSCTVYRGVICAGSESVSACCHRIYLAQVLSRQWWKKEAMRPDHLQTNILTQRWLRSNTVNDVKEDKTMTLSPCVQSCMGQELYFSENEDFL